MRFVNFFTNVVETLWIYYQSHNTYAKNGVFWAYGNNMHKFLGFLPCESFHIHNRRRQKFVNFFTSRTLKIASLNPRLLCKKCIKAKASLRELELRRTLKFSSPQSPKKKLKYEKSDPLVAYRVSFSHLQCVLFLFSFPFRIYKS